MRNAIGMEGWVRFSGFACLALVLSSGCSSIGTKIAVETGVCCPLDVSTYRSFSIDSSGVPKFLRLYFAEELAAVLRDKGLVESEPPQLNLVLRFERGALDGASPITITVDPGEQVQTPRPRTDADAFQRSMGSDTPGRFMARVVMEMRAADSEEILWSGVLTRVHNVSIGDYMHERARVPIKLAFQRLLEDFQSGSVSAP
ncbi:MAG: hypothetical protein E2O54_06625 [Gammaproteobacteria bacterium]|nr:MAG: hypothetical protein E2O75_03985 [Chloroflexota bacterium]TDJ25313.1 MAG: hypothetical protein E2O58_03560 [Gammaproteobacteria bacterium]TDJ40836.1 MAG: hypothetical protein E2O54_06625 [Gammaproteobacteria bacterium]